MRGLCWASFHSAQPTGLTEREIDDIVAFMKTLNDGWPAMNGNR